MLVEVQVQCRSFAHLDLSRNSIGAEGVGRIVKVMGMVTESVSESVSFYERAQDTRDEAEGVKMCIKKSCPSRRASTHSTSIIFCAAGRFHPPEVVVQKAGAERSQ